MAANNRLIDISQRSEWVQALKAVPHAHAHTWEYCAAMAESSHLPTLLYVAQQPAGRLVCSLSVRSKEEGCRELVSPYGFGGMASDCRGEPLHDLAQAWKDFARQSGFVSAYVMQHPAFSLDTETWDADLHAHHLLFMVDLTDDIDGIWEKMRKGYRYDIRRCESDPGVRLVTDHEALASALVDLYPQTVQRVGASEVYRFSTSTLRRLAQAPGCLLLGIETASGIEAVAMFLHTPYTADYFLNATTPEGRQHTRLLVWSAIKALKQLRVPGLNLGGGVRDDDTLAQFKRRFGGRTVRGQALKQIFDRDKYSCLCRRYCAAGHDQTGFFPPYWRPS